MLVGIYLFIGAVICAGIGLGVWLQNKLEATHQDLKMPSAMDIAA